MLFQFYTDRYFIHKKILGSAILKNSLFFFFFLSLTGCVSNQNLFIAQKVDQEFMNQSFILSGSISIKSNNGSFIGSYSLRNGLDESFQVNDVFGREVILIRPEISSEIFDGLDERFFEIYQLFEDWKSFSSILLATDDSEMFKSKLNLSITYKGYQTLQSFKIPKTISAIGNDYELTLTIKNLKIN
tara:strand:- start:54 stop:614 length:561 start_codon:yes stop_codon:yes gene_type:complete